jgi:hypothetical protein
VDNETVELWSAATKVLQEREEETLKKRVLFSLYVADTKDIEKYKKYIPIPLSFCAAIDRGNLMEPKYSALATL